MKIEGRKSKRQLEYQDYVNATQQILDQSKLETVPYKIKVAGKEFIIYPNVFSPKYFHDTKIFAENLPVKEGEEMLEIGPATGVVSIMAAYRGARKVLAIDINPDAVKNTKANIELHQMKDKVEVRQGDLYSPLLPKEKFDTIFWNTPFGFVENKDIPDLEKAVFDPGYVSTEKFITEAKQHLKQDGRLLIGFSTTLGRYDLLQQFVEKAHLSLRSISKTVSEEIHPVTFEIFEAEKICVDKKLQCANKGLGTSTTKGTLHEKNPSPDLSHSLVLRQCECGRECLAVGGPQYELSK